MTRPQTGRRLRPSKLVLDLGDLTFVDSTGLNLFARAKQRGTGVPVVLHRTSEQCRQILAITGLDTHFEITE